jgi:hypothetical protein
MEQVAAAACQFSDATTAIDYVVVNDRALWGLRFNLRAALRRLAALDAPKEGKCPITEGEI